MGTACSRDTFADLLKKNREQFTQWVCCQVSKQSITEKVTDSKKLVTKEVSQARRSSKTQLEKQKQQINKLFNDYKTKIPKENSESPQQFLGMSTIEEKINRIEKQTNTKLDDKQREMIAKLDSVQQSQFKRINQQQPQIPMINQLSTNEKRILIERGRKQFSQQIQQAKNKQMKTYQNFLNPATIIASIKETNSDDIKSLKIDAQKKFQSALQALERKGIANKGKKFLDSVFG